MDSISLPIDFINEYMLRANPAYAMVYLCAYTYKAQGLNVPESNKIAHTLSMKESDVNDAIKYWKSLGFDFESTKKIAKPIHKSVYSPTEISQHTSTDEQLRLLYEVAQNTLGKILSTADMQTLFWIYDYLGLSAEVIILIMNYAIREKKSTMRYIEKVAMNWAEVGIDTTEKAEELLTKLDKKRTYEHHIKSLLGINSRELTPSEKLIVGEWESTLKPNDELLISAFEINIERTGKLSIKYINGILKSWAEKGITTLAQVGEEKKPVVNNPKPTPTKFNNFTPRNDIDYKKLELEALQKRINKNRQVN